MPSPVVLKRRHSLVGKKLLALVKALRNYKGEKISQLARVRMILATEDLPRDELIAHFRDLTGETEKDILEMADWEATDSNLALLLHFAIIHANAVGQPSGQTLLASTSLPTITGITEDELDVEPPQKKVKVLPGRGQPTSGEGTKPCHTDDPSESLILLSLEELSQKALLLGHEDADMFRELTMQAHRNQGKVNLVSLTLSVLGGKASDLVSKALSKCLKEKTVKVDPVPKSSDQHRLEMNSPLSQVYPPHMAQNGKGYVANPYMYMPYAQMPQYGYPYSRMPRQNNRFFRPQTAIAQRHVGPCLFCDGMGHLVKDCMKLKALKQAK